MFNIVDETSRQSVSLTEVVTTAVLNHASFHSLCCLMNRKVKSFKQAVFLAEKYNVFAV